MPPTTARLMDIIVDAVSAERKKLLFVASFTQYIVLRLKS